MFIYKNERRKTEKKIKYIKLGRVYWIKPKTLPGFEESKVRPGIALRSFGRGKTIFIQIGTNMSNIPADIEATKLFRENIKANNEDLFNSNLHLDISKPEWNTSCIKPYWSKDNHEYVGLEYNNLIKLREMHNKRIIELEPIRIKKAKIYALKNNWDECRKQLNMLKNSNPTKYKNMDIDKLCEEYKKL